MLACVGCALIAVRKCLKQSRDAHVRALCQPRSAARRSVSSGSRPSRASIAAKPPHADASAGSAQSALLYSSSAPARLVTTPARRAEATTTRTHAHGPHAQRAKTPRIERAPSTTQSATHRRPRAGQRSLHDPAALHDVLALAAGERARATGAPCAALMSAMRRCLLVRIARALPSCGAPAGDMRSGTSVRARSKSVCAASYSSHTSARNDA